jgi:hypothetical protein
LAASDLLGSDFFNSVLANPLRNPNAEAADVVAAVALGGNPAADVPVRKFDLVDAGGGCGGRPAAIRGRDAGSSAGERAVPALAEGAAGFASVAADADERNALAGVRVANVDDGLRGRAGSPFPSGGVLPEFTASYPRIDATHGRYRHTSTGSVSALRPSKASEPDCAGLPSKSQAESDGQPRHLKGEYGQRLEPILAAASP